MSVARFRFDDALSAFLRSDLRGRSFDHECAQAATLKNAIEALGVPHTEVGTVFVNGDHATMQRIVREGDAVEVLPRLQEEIGSVPIFLADAHLGRLARFLRMLGFDSLHRNAFTDSEIRYLADVDGRIVLTRDRELLKCREIRRGCYVRTLVPEAQLREVAQRYSLAEHARPFTLCLCCNLALESVEKASVAARLPESVRATQEVFAHCKGCDRVYWPGSHYQRMRAAIDRLQQRS
jgi:hypothetical protein